MSKQVLLQRKPATSLAQGQFLVCPGGHPEIRGRFGYLVARQRPTPGTPARPRHCAATYLASGDIRAAQEVLGHSTIGITSDTYTSVFLELRRPNADAAT
ncbi:hypothetical protein [Actinoplanes sp. NPDC020271]|uniref:hypothetical protein n=1 Tax=Actinoplanes sp. NPDC020271 TaxID=3363896 RepID=UPI00378F0B42